MEWVEVRGETLEAAKEEALDQLGVARDDAEFEVVQEPESRWLGFRKTEARVRARVRPAQPRPKTDARQNRRRRGGRGGGRSQGGGGDGRPDREQQSRGGEGRSSSRRRSKGHGGAGDAKGNKGNDQRDGEGRGADRAGQGQAGRRNRSAPAEQRRDAKPDAGEKGSAVSEDTGRGELVPTDEQATMVTEFLEGVVAGFGVDARVATFIDDDVMVASIDGRDLGLLIGPKGGTMYAIQELARSAVQRRAEGRETGRLVIDVAGYRERRRAALAEFARRQADTVKAEGIELALEPMNSADRKAIHDAVMEIDGVKSISEGDEPRWVVLVPDEGS